MYNNFYSFVNAHLSKNNEYIENINSSTLVVLNKINGGHD